MQLHLNDFIWKRILFALNLHNIFNNAEESGAQVAPGRSLVCLQGREHSFLFVKKEKKHSGKGLLN